MMLQVTAYEVCGAVHVLVQTAEITESGRSWTLIVQELLEPKAPIQGSWDLAWMVARLIADRAEERADWHEIVPIPGVLPE